MRILNIRAIEGRNVHSHYPVIEMSLDLGQCAGISSDQCPWLSETLCGWLPGLATHHCSLGVEGGFLVRLTEGTYPGHVVEHVALELQASVGHRVLYGKTRRIDERLYTVVYEYECKEAGLCAGRMAVSLVYAALKRKHPDVSRYANRLRELSRTHSPGPSTAAIISAAESRGIPVRRLGDGCLFQLGYGSLQKRIQATLTSDASCISVDLAQNKTLTKMLLADAGLPVAESALATGERQALRHARGLGFPVVIKPNDGNQGKGVSTDIRVESEIGPAVQKAQRYSRRVLIERHVKGRDYRLAVVGDRVVAAAQRIPAFVVGDGRRSITELVEIENQNPLRGDGHEKPLTKILLDEDTKRVLEKQGFAMHTVLGRGCRAFLRETANLSTGGVAVDVTELVHPLNANMAVTAAAIIGLDVAGVDIVTENISLPMETTGGAIIEVNASPGIRMHHHPWKGLSRDVGREIVDNLFPSGNARIPIVAVTGTNGKTTTVRMIASVLREAGYRTGVTTTDGIVVGDTCVRCGDSSGPISAQTVLSRYDVDAAVFETARGGIIRGGLGFDRCDVGVITNIADDHIGQAGVRSLEDLAMVKSLIIEAVASTGCSVLNADDPISVAVAERSSSKILFFSVQPNNIAVRKHTAAGGEAVVLRNGNIVALGGGRPGTIISAQDIPATLGGAVWFNMQNALAAIAACVGMGVDKAKIASAMKKFDANGRDNPGRMNCVKCGGLTLMIDYAHNVPALEASAQAARALLGDNKSGGRLIGVVASPGDRSDDRIVALGRAAGCLFDSVIIKEDKDLRGRRPGEVAALLKRGARSAGATARVRIVSEERKALKAALNQANIEDLIVFYYEDYESAKKSVENLSVRFAPRFIPSKTLQAGQL